jgi:prolyl-tRNA synthetase
VMLDARDAYTPRWKFADWELRGVPLRIANGPKDIENSSVDVARRDTREKQSMPMAGLAEAIGRLLEEIQQARLTRAVAFRD